MEVIKQFTKAVQSPASYMRDLKIKTDKKVVGYCCTYTPEEIIYAAGALPVRLFGAKEGISKADAHLQAYSCSLVRGIMGDALQGNLDYLDAMIFPHTCDSIQRLSDIWRLNILSTWHNDVVLPVKLGTLSSKEYMADVLEKFRKEIGDWIGRDITDDDLKNSIKVYNNLRLQLKRLYEIKSANPSVISGRDLYMIVKGSTIIDRAETARLLEELVSSLENKAETGKDDSKARIVLSGGICDHPDIYDLIEAAGGTVVWDDLCSGSRFFEGRIAEAGNPVNAIAKRYTDRVVCPAKHSSLKGRGENLVNIVKDNDARGVIFLLLKFCDPHAFDYPFIKEMLDEINVPSMLLEIEQELPSSGQLATRFEAFLGML